MCFDAKQNILMHLAEGLLGFQVQVTYHQTEERRKEKRGTEE